MTEHLAECFVNLPGQTFTLEPLTKFRLDQAKRRFYIGSLTIVLNELVADVALVGYGPLSRGECRLFAVVVSQSIPESAQDHKPLQNIMPSED